MLNLLDEIDSLDQNYEDLWEEEFDILVENAEDSDFSEEIDQLVQIKQSLNKYTPTRTE